MDTLTRMRYEKLYPNLPKKYDKMEFLKKLREINDEVGLPPDVFPALVHVESKGDPYAKSEAGAMGWAQLMPGTAKKLKVDPYSEGALKPAAQYLKDFMRPGRFVYDDLDTALQRYNAGADTVGEWLLGKRDLKQETVEYPRKVRDAMQMLQHPPLIEHFDINDMLYRPFRQR